MRDGKSAYTYHRKLWRRVRFNFIGFVVVVIGITALNVDQLGWSRANLGGGLFLLVCGAIVFALVGYVFWMVCVISKFVSREYADADLQDRKPEAPLIERHPPPHDGA